MRRRDLMLLLGGALGATPAVSRAQGTPLPVVGFISSRSPTDSVHILAAFRDGLRAAGYVEGRNVGIEFRWAEGQYDRLPGLAADLVDRRIAVLVAVGGDPKHGLRKPVKHTNASDILGKHSTSRRKKPSAT